MELRNLFKPALLLFLFSFSAILLRMPQIFGGNLLPDGDECIVGLMSKHLMEWRTFPLFFYGQNYGLTIFETAITALSFNLFGVSILVLKLTMLFLWILGAWLFVLAARQFQGDRASYIVAFLLLVMPAWAAGAMNARGFYFTAFINTGFSLWLIARIRNSKGRYWPHFAILGVSLGITLLSQPLWLSASLPFLFLLVFLSSNRRNIFYTLLFFLLLSALMLLNGWVARSSYWNPGVFADISPWTALSAMSLRLAIVFSGAYFYYQPVYIGPFAIISGVCGVIMMLLLISKSISNFYQKRQYSELSAVALGILILTGGTLFMNNDNFGFRYLLSVPTLTALGLGFLPIDQLWKKHANRIFSISLLTTFSLCGILAYNEFTVLSGYGRANEIFNEKNEGEVAAMESLLTFLREKKVKYVYSLHPTLQWNITFGSQEQIIARWTNPIDRFPEYPLLVDQALYNEKLTAMVDFNDSKSPLKGQLAEKSNNIYKRYVINQRYIVLISPSMELIKFLGFKINDPL
jgi:hypothetical protein